MYTNLYNIIIKEKPKTMTFHYCNIMTPVWSTRRIINKQTTSEKLAKRDRQTDSQTDKHLASRVRFDLPADRQMDRQQGSVILLQNV